MIHGSSGPREAATIEPTPETNGCTADRDSALSKWFIGRAFEVNRDVLATKIMQHARRLCVVFAFVASNVLADEPAGNEQAEAELRLFDPNVFGKTPSDPVTLLLPGTQSIQPRYIQVDLHDGRYFAATITYDKVDFETARRSINKRYKKYEYLADEDDFALWRNVDDGYAIQLSSPDDEDNLRIAYINFPPTSLILESIREAGVFDDVSEPFEQTKPEPSDARESPN